MDHFHTHLLFLLSTVYALVYTIFVQNSEALMVLTIQKVSGAQPTQKKNERCSLSVPHT